VKKTNASGTPGKATPIRKSVSSPAIRKASPASARAKATERALCGSGSKDDGFVEVPASVPETVSNASTPAPDIVVVATEPSVGEPKILKEPVTSKGVEVGAKPKEENDIPAQKHTNGVKSGNDIEDIVNLLQFVPVAKISSSSSEGNGSLAGDRRVVSPDEVHDEIPDEE